MVEKMFKPRKERKSFGLPIIVSLTDNSIKLPARLNNMSEGGINFKSNAFFPVGEIVEVDIPYPKQIMMLEDKKPIIFKVRIIWSKDFHDEKDPLIKYIHGCQFVSDESNKETEGVEELIKLSEKLGQKPMGF
ncbi:MAG: PilZ domain-containing protein [Proteobacteria bacterium]|nr:PilZ domain-containing protein [Pseudomonadota bacterium]